ncbi:MAG: hypothetical protein ACUVYA_15295 [Planctomycetota bacterium]
MSRCFVFVGFMGFVGVGILSGCGSEDVKAGAGKERVNLPYEWWNNPGEVDDHMAAVGASPCPNAASQGSARTFAEADGRQKIAASIQARITSLVENWAKIVGDTSDQQTFTSLINNEGFTRQFVDRSVVGARAVTYKYLPEEKTLYALMVVQDPAAWMVEFRENSLEKAAQTLLWTQAQKEDFRKKMDEIQKRYAEEDRSFLDRLVPARPERPAAESQPAAAKAPAEEGR